MWIASSGDSDEKIFLFNKNGPFQSDALLKKIRSQKTSLKENKEKTLINKVKCFTENDNHEVLSGRKFLFWFPKDQNWVEIK